MSHHQISFIAYGDTSKSCEEHAHSVAAQYFGEGRFAIESIAAEPEGQLLDGQVPFWSADVVAVKR